MVRILACADTLNGHGRLSVGVFKRPFRFDSMLHMYLRYLFSFFPSDNSEFHFLHFVSFFFSVINYAMIYEDDR